MRIISLVLLFASLALAQESNYCPMQDLDPEFKELITQHLPKENENRSEEPQRQLLIFLSSSMPKQSLVIWAKQAMKLNGALLLQGFVGNSIPNTSKYTIEIFGNPPISGFLIDPERFTKYNIKQVPAVVLVNNGTYDLVYGDIGLEEALKIMGRKGSNAELAKLLLTKYRANSL